jgi:hypothetical protein
VGFSLERLDLGLKDREGRTEGRWLGS